MPLNLFKKITSIFQSIHLLFHLDINYFYTIQEVILDISDHNSIVLSLILAYTHLLILGFISFHLKINNLIFSITY